MIASAQNQHADVNQMPEISAAVVHDVEIGQAGLVCVVLGGGTGLIDNALIPLDAVFLRQSDDIRLADLQKAQHFVVTRTGFDLAADLLRSDILDPGWEITWCLDSELRETLKMIGLVGMPRTTAVVRVSGRVESVTVTTAGDTGRRADAASFIAGHRVAVGLSNAKAVALPEDSTKLSESLATLRLKHLNLLETLGSYDVPDTLELPAEKIARLENELVVVKDQYQASELSYGLKLADADSELAQRNKDYALLQSKYSVLQQKHVADTARCKEQISALQLRYEVLERKYGALARSRLGRVTLWHWRRRRRLQISKGTIRSKDQK